MKMRSIAMKTQSIAMLLKGLKSIAMLFKSIAMKQEYCNGFANMAVLAFHIRGCSVMFVLCYVVFRQIHFMFGDVRYARQKIVVSCICPEGVRLYSSVLD